MTTYFGFALADSMFVGECTIDRHELTIEDVRRHVTHGVTPCLNPSHQATIAAMRSRFGLDVAIPANPPRVELRSGDSLIVMGVRGLPRLTDRHEYSEAEIAAATFRFSFYYVR
ncbi:hypothetical protein COT97_04695 [Candidatus Falkowbacteria bacterium CG10_big_fil_rev_8_21_14_0_10_39_11]|uniref:Uncharacterized protein n=1 Tax=Candidatus Falkowbacteria bacterium CG10_big_fil_rev_8_21_14_0_10_39_11 TaxID=1974565 RepID=A0A2H0V412_9BACT|nr:MAG: hypothetical protein COT97_04695 [Candidatus Falkowbacteria bacterium CG10_big_fil_rev_8_21_14_0_10_39_11]